MVELPVARLLAPWWRRLWAALAIAWREGDPSMWP